MWFSFNEIVDFFFFLSAKSNLKDNLERSYFVRGPLACYFTQFDWGGEYTEELDSTVKKF